MFWFWAFEKKNFWVIFTRPLKRLPTYLSHRGLGPNVVEKKVLKNLFWNEVSLWVIVTGPLKRLPTYLSHRGSGPDVVQTKKFWKMNFWNESLFLSFYLLFFFFKKSNLIRMRFFEILSFSNEQKVVFWTTSLTNRNAQFLTWSHWLERI